MNNLDELKAIDIKNLIEKETGLHFTKNGGLTLEKCPFCGSGTGKKGTPGFSIKPAVNIFNCFACGKKGNPIEFIQYFKGYKTKEAIQFLQKQYVNAPLAQEPGKSKNRINDIATIINAIKRNPVEKATAY